MRSSRPATNGSRPFAARDEPARLIELDQRAMSAARVDEWESEALGEAQAVREGAKRQLDAARATLARAREDLEKARAAIDEPLQAADRPLEDRFQALIFCWPTRVSMRSQPGWEMDAIDLALARWLCETSADDLGVVPARLAAQIRAEAAQEATKQLRGLRVSIPGTAVDTTVGALVGAPVTR